MVLYSFTETNIRPLHRSAISFQKGNIPSPAVGYRTSSLLPARGGLSSLPAFPPRALNHFIIPSPGNQRLSGEKGKESLDPTPKGSHGVLFTCPPPVFFRLLGSTLLFPDSCRQRVFCSKTGGGQGAFQRKKSS